MKLVQPMKEDKKVIDIDETTIEAFTTMINFIYSKSKNLSISNIQDPELLFEVLNVANRYMATGLTEAVENLINNLELSLGNVISAAAIAQDYGHFEKASSALTNNCAKFLDKTLGIFLV